MTSTTASVIVAALDEGANIDHVMDTALASESVIEVVIADGGSVDSTINQINARAAGDPRVKLIHNPDGGQSAGLNRAAAIATGDVLVRLDGHTRYAPDYVEASIDATLPDTAVGGPMLAEGTTSWSRATALAMEDPLAIGPARFHHAEKVETVDTVYLGTFARVEFLGLGGYRTFPSGTVEDTDFYARWRSSGRTVLVDPSIKSWYRPRETWLGLARQYFRYGRGKAELIWLNKRLPSVRPFPPALLVAGLVIATFLGVVTSWWPLLVVAGVWTAALTVVGLRASELRVRTALVAATMHASYGFGLWFGLASGRPNVVALGLANTDQSSSNREPSEGEHE